MKEIIEHPFVKEYIERIRIEVPMTDIYEQLAEEALELSQAAIKMSRLESETNPTGKTREEAINNLREEYTDVLNIAMRILEIEPDWLQGDYKMMRWCKRIDRAKKKESNGINENRD